MIEKILKGTSLSAGIAIGRPTFLNRNQFHTTRHLLDESAIEGEIDRYRSALFKSRRDVKRLQKQLEAEAVIEGVLILEAELEMLRDPLITVEIENRIRIRKQQASFVFQQAVVEFQKKIQAIEEPFFTDRLNDFQDLARRVLAYLHESTPCSIPKAGVNTIICASELTAMDAASAKACAVEGFITEIGGSASHAAIIAKAKKIPFVTGIDLKWIRHRGDQLLILDGAGGKIILSPSEKTIREYQQLQAQLISNRINMEKVIPWPAETKDGHSIRLMANIDGTCEMESVKEMGGEGIGLLRSEYLFLPTQSEPSEEEQFLVYKAVAEIMGDAPVTIRTFDLSGDKIGLQAVSKVMKTGKSKRLPERSFFIRPTLLRTQLKAILRASAHGNVNILFPMIATLQELKEGKKMVKEVAEELEIPLKVRVGCMIEVPSAALLADHFADECDFFSIGTNDLVQYALAIDRGVQGKNSRHDLLDPSVIRLIKLVSQEAKRANIPVCVCGEIAADPRFVPLLIGLGVKELSVAIPHLPVIKDVIRKMHFSEAACLTDQVMQLRSSEEILELLDREYLRIVSHH